MIHLRLIVPSDLRDQVLSCLTASPATTNVWHLPDAASKPAGDLVSCDVAKEEGSALLRELRALGLERRGSIAVENVDASVSRGAREAERAAPGSPADAIVWEEVEGRIAESTDLSLSYLAFFAIATMIAAVGVITDSIVLIIGAMVVGPEFGPLAGFCVAVVQRRGRLAARSLTALAVGFPAGILAAAALTTTLLGLDVAPAELERAERELTLFISEPNWYSFIVALLAGVAGMMALISAKSGPLVGVLISVTTIPAAADVGVSASYGAWTEAQGAAAQLAINASAILLSGFIVLWLSQRGRRGQDTFG